MGRPEDVQSDPEELGLTGSALYEHLTKSDAPAALLDAEWRVNALAARNANDALQQPSDRTSAANEIETPGRELPGLRPETRWIENGFKSRQYFTDKYCTATDRFFSCGGPSDDCTSDSVIEKSGINMMQAGFYSVEGHNYYYGYFGTVTDFPNSGGDAGAMFGWRYTSGINRRAGSVGWPESPVYGSFIHCVNYHY